MKRMLIVLILTASLLAAGFSNPGTRHETALSLSDQARAYYSDASAPEVLAGLPGSSVESEAAVWGSPLCAALHSLMNDSRTGLLSYAETLSAFPNTDCSGGSEEPLRFYCDDFGASYNREQLWADLHGAFYHDGAGRDLHHLRPTDPEANFVRGTQCFGNVQGRFDGAQRWPAEGEPVFRYVPDWNGGQGLAEPRDGIKGDVARILLYVYVTWGQADGGTRNLWTDLPPCGAGLTESDGKRVIEDPDTLLEWMALDPVDTWELGRNDAIQSLQGSRNVFIDYPELAFRLFDRAIPDMPTPSGWAHSAACGLAVEASPETGGVLSVTEGPLGEKTVSAAPSPGWTPVGWSLTPEGAAAVEQNGNVFTVSALREDCTLTVRFELTNPCVNGHSWDAGIVTVQPGCTEPGSRTYTCSVCGATRRESVPALGHDWHRTEVTPSCVRPGYTVDACWRCGLEIETPGAPPLGHAWDEGTVIRPPTKTEPGELRFRCTRCGASRTEAIPFRFADVNDEGLWYFDAVYWALHHEPPVTSGTDEIHFSPALDCTRSQIMTFLWRACGSPAPESSVLLFTDVPEDAWYRDPVLWAVERGITAGTAEHSFSPDAACTRAEVVTFLWAAAGRPEPEGTAPPFEDIFEDAWYYRAAHWAAEQGITAGTAPGVFSPGRICTRAQAVTMLYQLYGP